MGVQDWFDLAVIWLFVASPNSCVEILMPSVMVLGGVAFGKWLGHEGGAFLSDISALIKEAPESSFAPFCYVRIQWEVCNKEEGLTWPWWHLDLGVPSLQNCEQ